MCDIMIFLISLMWIVASMKSKSQKNKMATAGEPVEYRCLIRATDGKQKISTTVCFFFPSIFQAQC